MVNLPTIDIIIPNYNKGKYIEECINSVLNQSYKNWQLYFIDDNSTDNSREIISKFKNYRNDYAFAIALHQLKGQIKTNDFIPTPMNMLPHEYDVLDVDAKSVVYQYNKKVNVVTDMDVHVLDKEFINVG